MPSHSKPSVELNVDIHAVGLLEFVKTNYLQKSLTSLCFEVFQIVCKSYSLDLTYSPRLQSRVRYFVSNLIKRIRKPWSGSGAKRSFKSWCEQNPLWKLHILPEEVKVHALVNKVQNLEKTRKKS